MTLDQLYMLSEIIAAIAVVVSLIYVGVQVRENTRATRATAAQSFVDTMNGYVGLINSSSSLADVLDKGSAGLSDMRSDEIIQFSAFHDQSFIAFESYFYQWRDGILDERLWDTYRHALVDLLHMEGGKEWWENRSHWFSQDFVREVARLKSEVSSKPMHFGSANA